MDLSYELFVHFRARSRNLKYKHLYPYYFKLLICLLLDKEARQKVRSCENPIFHANNRKAKEKRDILWSFTL